MAAAKIRKNFILAEKLDMMILEYMLGDIAAGAASCSSGLHASTPFYTTDGDTIIAVKVELTDIITCQEGKVRCKALTVIGEVKP